MPLTPTVRVVWRPDRERWAVEGGNGTTAVLGIVSLHERKRAALRAAREVAREHDARVEVVDDPAPPRRSTGEDG